MTAKRDAVLAADEQGDAKAIKQALIDLQEYVSSHMNTSLGNGIYLAKQYERDRTAALEAAASSTNPNAALYQQAAIDCQERWQGGVESFRNDYVACVAERVRALGAAAGPNTGLNLPRVENYHYNFVSPRWSVDLAGFAILLGSVIVVRIALVIILRLILRYHFRAL